MKAMSSKQKGDLLEQIVEKLCTDYKNAKVSRDVKVKGKSGVERQIDVLIEASYKSFDIKIIIEAKNYSSKIDIGIVDGVRTKITDVGGNLGVIVCPLGFTEGAVKAAALHDIQLFQVFDHQLGNTTQFIPLRYIVPSMKAFQVSIEHKASGGGRFELPMETQKWRIHIGKETFDPEEASVHAWNEGMLLKKAGTHLVDFGVVKISTVDDPKKFFYLELKMSIIVIEKYYLTLLPASFMKNVKSGKGNHALRIRAYSKHEDMVKNGWRYFETKEAMEAAAAPDDTSPDMRGMTMTEDYTITLR